MSAPDRLGPYRLLEELAVGGMAHVFVAKRDGTVELCALKRLLPELLAHPIAGPRFTREAHLASQLFHPNIGQILDAGLAENTFYMAMELIAGLDLEDLNRRSRERSGGPIAPELVVAIADQALAGLEYAHSAKDASGEPLAVVHRDLSPRNVMLGHDGVVKIIDFGVARARLDRFKTAPGTIVGSIRYFSPEQARAGELDHRSDLYTLAVVLWELLAGRDLLPRKASLFETLKAVIEIQVPPLSSFGLPKGLDDVFARALAKDVRQRFPSAEAFRLALAGVGLEVPGRDALKALIAPFAEEGERRIAGWRQAARTLENFAPQWMQNTAKESAPPEHELEPTHIVPRGLDEPEDGAEPTRATGVTEPGSVEPPRVLEPKVLPLLPAAPRSGWSTRSVVALVAGGVLLAVAINSVVMLRLLREDRAPPPPVERPAPVAARALPAPVAPVEITPPPPPRAEESRAERPRKIDLKPRRTIEKIEAPPPAPPPPPVQVEDDLGPLRSMLARHEANPTAKSLVAFFSAVREKARSLPQPRRAEVERVLQELTFSLKPPDAAARLGFEALLKARAE